MFNAKFSSADEVFESIYRKAKRAIYVVDNYIGLRTLVHLKNTPVGVQSIILGDIMPRHILLCTNRWLRNRP